MVARKYELRRRAEAQAATRQRIVDAAIQLHQAKGPSQTSLSEVARLAGVQRHTLYRHFPSEWELGLACSGSWWERNPPPDPESWLAIGDVAGRLRRGLAELYAFYERGEEMIASVLRDAEVDPVTRELMELRGGGSMMRIREVLATGLPRRRRVQATLDLAVDFQAWRRLARSGLSSREAAETMAAAVLGQ